MGMTFDAVGAFGLAFQLLFKSGPSYCANQLDYAVVRRHNDFLEVPFPEKQERIVLIKDTLAPISDITDDQFKVLAEKTDQCSYFEILTMISKVLKSNAISDQKKEWFRLRKDGTYVASERSDKRTVKLNFLDIPKGALRGPKIRYDVVLQQFEKAIRASQSSHLIEINDFKEKYDPPTKKEDKK
jgi:hypothetical protein